jgi:FAD/FMN-containing dehydrogenase
MSTSADAMVDRAACGVRLPLKTGVLQLLAEVVGRGDLLVDPELMGAYEIDATGCFGGRASCIVRPSSSKEVADVLKICGRTGTRVVIQGGNTGLAGGGVPCNGEAVIRMDRLNEIARYEEDPWHLVAGAGATLTEVREAARKAGLEFALDFPARDSATVGGMVATNAAGPTALRWGAMRAQVAGLEAVTASGAVLSRLVPVSKDNAGYDWPALIAGSEGTLAVVTRARLRLHVPPAARDVFMVGAADYDDAVRLTQCLRSRLGSRLEALDFMDRPSVEMVCATHRLREPLPETHGVYLVGTVLTEHEGDAPALELLAQALPELPDETIVGAVDGAGRRRLWKYREAINEALRTRGEVHKYDVSLPLQRLPLFVAAITEDLARRSELGVYLYGHLGDGNVHVNLLGVTGFDRALDDLVLKRVASLGGSIDAEHGVGLAKRDHLGLTRTDAELALMRQVKQILDPAGILGSGRVFLAEEGL